jgi:hypothetical protein
MDDLMWEFDPVEELYLLDEAELVSGSEEDE